jgi:hypothetical protein
MLASATSDEQRCKYALEYLRSQQTEAELNTNQTIDKNFVGFSKATAAAGTLLQLDELVDQPELLQRALSIIETHKWQLCGALSRSVALKLQKSPFVRRAFFAAIAKCGADNVAQIAQLLADKGIRVDETTLNWWIFEEKRCSRNGAVHNLLRYKRRWKQWDFTQDVRVYNAKTNSWKKGLAQVSPKFRGIVIKWNNRSAERCGRDSLKFSYLV